MVRRDKIATVQRTRLIRPADRLQSFNLKLQ